MGVCDLSQAQAAALIAEDGIAIELERMTADVPAFEPGAPHAGAHPLDNEIAFEFGDRIDDGYDSTAQRPPVSICSRNDANSMLRWLNSSRISRKCFTDRAIRSEAQTRTTSKRPRRASRIRSPSPGRRARQIL